MFTSKMKLSIIRGEKGKGIHVAMINKSIINLGVEKVLEALAIEDQEEIGLNDQKVVFLSYFVQL